jgi:hypothetical protein
MKIKKTEVGIVTSLAVLLIILTPILNPWITVSLGVAIIILCLVIHFARVKKDYAESIKTKQGEAGNDAAD